MAFIELHFHDDYGSNTRLTDTINKIEPCMNYAASIGLKGLAITDHESLSAHIKALQYLPKVREKYPEFQLILGNEIYLCNNTEQIDGRYQIESKEFYHFILLAKDAVGHRQLRELSSRAWDRCYSYKGIDRVPTFKSDVEEIVGKNPGHLVASTACLAGEFDKLVLAGDVDGSLTFIKWCQKQFGSENFFLELQPGLTEDQIRFNKGAVQFAKYFNVPWIITNDVHYMSKDKETMHRVFLQSHEEERETADFYESTYFKTEAEMKERMSYLNEADLEAGFANTMKIGEMCKDAGDYGLFHTTIVPQRELPDFTVRHTLDTDAQKYPYIHTYYGSTDPQDQWLMKQLEDGANIKHMPMDDEHLNRINYELEQLWKISEHLHQPMSAYYNLTQLLVDIMWNDEGRYTPPGEANDESVVGVSRGSVGGWYLAYLMSIIQIDPIKWGAVAWRHLHASRPDIPDCDIDSCASKRDAILKRVKYVFGEDHCLNTITFRTETTKSAIRTACRGLGIDNDVSGELSGLVPMTRGKVWTLKECYNGNDDNDNQPVTELVNRIKEYEGLYEAISEIEGLVSGRGIHASSVFIYNESFLAHNSMMKSPNGLPCTCWDMTDSEACSGLKEDFLTVESCDKIQTCLELLVADNKIEYQGSLKKTYDKYIHPDVLNYTDQGMWDAADDGCICNLFQMDTPVGAEAIRKVRPSSLKELSLTNSVMRLMGNEDTVPIDHFVDMKNHPDKRQEEMRQAGLTEEEMAVIDGVLKDNYNCSIEQEDLMRLCMEPRIANFTMTEANKIRKAVAKKKAALVEESQKLFFKKGLEAGNRQAFLDYVWKYDIKPQLG